MLGVFAEESEGGGIEALWSGALIDVPVCTQRGYRAHLRRS